MASKSRKISNRRIDQFWAFEPIIKYITAYSTEIILSLISATYLQKYHNCPRFWHISIYLENKSQDSNPRNYHDEKIIIKDLVKLKGTSKSHYVTSE